MQKGEILKLENVSLNPDEITYIDFVTDKNKRESVDIVFIKIPAIEFTIQANEIEKVKQFAELNNMVRYRDVKALG